MLLVNREFIFSFKESRYRLKWNETQNTWTKMKHGCERVHTRKCRRSENYVRNFFIS